MRKNKELSVEELMEKEISVVEANDKLAKLEKEKLKNKKIIAEYKEREKVSARALVLYERKIKYLKELIINDILSICKNVDQTKQGFETLSDEALFDELTHLSDRLYDVCNKMEANAVLSKKDRAFISNQPLPEENLATDLDSRFNRLKQEFAQKIGSSVERKRGRPKKEDQSIVADIGLGKKVESSIETDAQVESKINQLFYAAPTQKSVVSAIPTTDDSLFDFNEALNPNISLKDIMADIMNDKQDEEVKVYGENREFDEIDDNLKIEMLESGFIRNPIIRTRPSRVSSSVSTEPMKKTTFEKRFMSIQDIVNDETK